MSKPLRFAILGMGGRGREAYGSWIRRHPQRAVVVGIADPVAARREAPELPDAERFADWRDLIDALPRLGADAAVVALPDHLHVEPMRELLRLGLPTLLEKPIAPTLDSLEELVGEIGHTDQVAVTVGHVLRFTTFWRTIHELISAGTIGQIATMEIRENIGFWHFAHSYVRGNWRNTAESSPMVLAKTCHDLDLIRWLMGSAPETVASSGSLLHFRAENAPAGAPAFCLDGCPAADVCPFYAPRYYVEALKDVHGIPVTLVTSDTSVEGRLEALRHSDYGRCVYHSDNDVADHQSTVMSFADGATATLTASAFTPENTRHVTITGSRGQIEGHMDSGRITVDLFSPSSRLPDSTARFEVGRTRRGKVGHESIELQTRPDRDNLGDHRGHAGGDDALMEQFVAALERGDLADTEALSVHAALDSHLMAFAAEESRLSGQTINFRDWLAHRRKAVEDAGADH